MENSLPTYPTGVDDPPTGRTTTSWYIALVCCGCIRAFQSALRVGAKVLCASLQPSPFFSHAYPPQSHHDYSHRHLILCRVMHLPRLTALACIPPPCRITPTSVSFPGLDPTSYRPGYGTSCLRKGLGFALRNGVLSSLSITTVRLSLSTSTHTNFK